jgi:MerR family transcriptional regulator, mercuric resistance operon regulatory protein
MATRSSSASFTISGLAAAAEVSIETVRYYQRRGLLHEPARPPGGVRRYASAEVDQLRFIKRAQAMGFTLEEIRNLLKLRTQNACHATRALAVTKLRLIDTNIRELQQLREELAQLVTACDANAGESHCPVIERLTH